jgi:hypothetical protein
VGDAAYDVQLLVDAAEVYEVDRVWLGALDVVLATFEDGACSVGVFEAVSEVWVL